MTNTASTVSKPSEPTPDEQPVVGNIRRREKRTPRLRVDYNPNGVELSFDHLDDVCGQTLLMNAMASTDWDFCTGILNELARASTLGQKMDERRLNCMFSIIKGVEPKDELETMLAAQMAAVHGLTMIFAQRLGNAENLIQQDSAERAFNKLARTFAAQLEALKRYRTGGEQKVTVEHVTVNEGGKAIVGNVTHGGQGSPQKVETTP